MFSVHLLNLFHKQLIKGRVKDTERAVIRSQMRNETPFNYKKINKHNEYKVCH